MQTFGFSKTQFVPISTVHIVNKELTEAPCSCLAAFCGQDDIFVPEPGQQRLSVTEDAPVDVSEARRESDWKQLDSELKSVPRSTDYAAFDVERAFAEVEKLAAAIRSSGTPFRSILLPLAGVRLSWAMAFRACPRQAWAWHPAWYPAWYPEMDARGATTVAAGRRPCPAAGASTRPRPVGCGRGCRRP